MKRKLFLLTGIIFVLLSGCGKEKNSAVKDQFESGYMELFGTHPAVTKKGDFQVMEGIAYFTDYKNQICTPICNKPDCRHLSVYEDEDTQCNAVCDGVRIFPYKEKLYRIRTTEKGKSELVLSDLDGSNLKSGGTFDTGSLLTDAVVRKNKLYYVSMVMNDATGEITGSGEATETPVWKLCSLDLDTMDKKLILEIKDARSFCLLGGNEEYQFYAVIKDRGAEYYRFDYLNEETVSILLNTGSYSKIKMSDDGKSLYYVGNDGKEIYKYETETEKISSVVGAGELKKITAATEIELVIEGEHEGTVLFRILPENELYVKKGTEILRTGLSERLPEEAAWLGGIRSTTEEGFFFSYQANNEKSDTEGDLITWYAYISWSELFDKNGKIKVVHSPHISSAGNLL